MTMTAPLKRDMIGPDATPVAPAVGRAVAAERPTIIILNKQELLGEALQRVPAYRALRFAFPDHRIVCLAQGPSAFATSLAPIRHLFMDDTVPDSIKSGTPMELRRLARNFGPLDIVMDLRSNLRLIASWLAFYPAAPRYVANGSLLTTRKGVRGFAEVRPQSHAERYHRMAEIVAGRRLPFDPGLPVLPEADAIARRLLPDGARYFGFAGIPHTANKAWPRERLAPIAGHVRDLGLTPVVLLGKDESEERDWYAANLPGAIIISLADAGGDAGLLVWILHAAAGRLAGALSSENGLGHLVACTGVPLITLAGPTNPIRWRPLTRFWWPVRAQDFGGDKMADIPVDAVAATVTAMIRSREGRAARYA